MDIKTKLTHVPTDPGCYLMKDMSGVIIYVGKAKNLKNRLKSYFTGSHNIKTTRLVSEIVDFLFVVTNSEQESLILELNLIKQHQPKYNILLTDDKTYPFIEIIKEATQNKIIVVRKKHLRGKLFGPYPNSYAARQTADLLAKMFPMGSYDPIPNFFKSVGDALIGHDPTHAKALLIVNRFLKGDTKQVVDALKVAMNEASEKLEFEKAQNYKSYLEHIKTTTEKQLISLNDFKNRDVIGFDYDLEDISLHMLFMRQGRIVDQHQQVFSYVGDPLEELVQVLQQYYEGEYPDEMLFSSKMDEAILKDNFENIYFIPQKGDKKKLVDLASKNANYDLKHYNLVYRNKTQNFYEGLEALEKMIEVSPIHKIEIFDNAHLFGASPISALIVYENGKLAKKEYRKYHLQTAIQDDYQSFREVIYRRYQRLLVEDKKLPDLILVDGGMGQVHAAQDALEMLNLKVPIAGLKKDNRHKLTALVYDEKTTILLKTTPIYKFLLYLSEEVHRFAISFFKKTHQKASKKSFLDDIKGVGPRTKKKLLETFNSIDHIKNASYEELQKIGIRDDIIKAIKENKDT